MNTETIEDLINLIYLTGVYFLYGVTIGIIFEKIFVKVFGQFDKNKYDKKKHMN